MMQLDALKEFLDFKNDQFNNPAFVEDDPVSIPHMFSKHADIEISGFLMALISWGRREQIVIAGYTLMQRLDFSPYEFVINASEKEFGKLHSFVYRTFNETDLVAFVKGLQIVYQRYGSLESAFVAENETIEMGMMISRFKQRFFDGVLTIRSAKHLADPLKGSAAKRINMFLRWMVRNDKRGVDMGIWKRISPAQLICPLDVHSGTVARKLGLLYRKNNDWQAALELTGNLRKLDPVDPVRYDFALFGLGWYEKF